MLPLTKAGSTGGRRTTGWTAQAANIEPNVATRHISRHVPTAFFMIPLPLRKSPLRILARLS
jgi:hypothetical protein